MCQKAKCTNTKHSPKHVSSKYENLVGVPTLGNSAHWLIVFVTFPHKLAALREKSPFSFESRDFSDVGRCSAYRKQKEYTPFVFETNCEVLLQAKKTRAGANDKMQYKRYQLLACLMRGKIP